MALNPMGTLDLSNITDFLIFNLKDYWPNSPLWNSLSLAERFVFHVGGEMPLEPRSRTGETCQVSVYLFHVEQDKYQRNSPVTGPYSSSGASRVPTIPYQPLSLDLYYLVTAYSKDYHEEQRAMSIILRFFHENPILRGSVLLPVVAGNPPVTIKQEFCLTMEAEAQDTMSRLWQSFTAPFRMGLVYKVGIVFISPPAEDKPIAPNPKYIELTANPALLPAARNGLLLGSSRTVTYASTVDPTPGQTRQIFRFQQNPANVMPANPLPADGPLNSPSRFYLQGIGLNQATSYRVYLILPDNSEIEVTQWKVKESLTTDPPAKQNAGDPPRQFQTDSQIVLDLPNKLQAIPDGSHAPFPNVYRIRVGSDKSRGDASSFSSNAVPVSVAAWVSLPAAYPASPVLAQHADGSYTVDGRGFVPGNTEVLLETVALDPAPGVLKPGEFIVSGPNTIDFIPPDDLPKGLFAVRVRVNHVESDPSVWINKP